MSILNQESRLMAESDANSESPTRQYLYNELGEAIEVAYNNGQTSILNLHTGDIQFLKGHRVRVVSQKLYSLQSLKQDLNLSPAPRIILSDVGLQTTARSERLVDDEGRVQSLSVDSLSLKSLGARCQGLGQRFKHILENYSFGANKPLQVELDREITTDYFEASMAVTTPKTALFKQYIQTQYHSVQGACRHYYLARAEYYAPSQKLARLQKRRIHRLNRAIFWRQGVISASESLIGILDKGVSHMQVTIAEAQTELDNQ